MNRRSFKKHVHRALVVGGLAALALAVSTAPAGAKPLEKGKFHETSSEVIEDFCGDLTVEEAIDIRGTFLLNTHGPNGLAYFSSSSHGTIVWTNLANDKTFTQVGTFHDKDQRVTDNGDGTLTILVKTTGSSKFYGPDGKLLFNDPGQVVFEVLVDHGGTPNDPADDVFLDATLVKGPTGRNDTEGRDFCDDIHEFIG